MTDDEILAGLRARIREWELLHRRVLEQLAEANRVMREVTAAAEKKLQCSETIH